METKITPTTATTKKQDDQEIERMVVAQATTDRTGTSATEQQAGQENELDERDSKGLKVHP